MLLQLSCSTSHTSHGSSTLTFLIVQHVPQPAPGHSQWSQAYEPPTREGKWQSGILCCCSTRHLFLEPTKQEVGPLSIFLVNTLSFDYVTSSLFIWIFVIRHFSRPLFHSPKGSLKIFFSLRDQGTLSTVLMKRSEHRSPATLSPEVSGCPFFLPHLRRVVFVIFWT